MVHEVDLLETLWLGNHFLMFLCCTFSLQKPLWLLSRIQALVYLWIWVIDNVAVVGNLFSLSLYASSLSASIYWIWNTQFSMLLWIRYHRSSDIPAIFIALMTQLLILAFRIESSISIIVVLVSAAIFIISLICLYTLIIASSPFNIL